MKALDFARSISGDSSATALKLGESGCSVFRIGVPLIDLATYATLTEEVYALPNGKACADEIRTFAKEISELLETELGDFLFKFGEVRQYILSSRFKIGKDPRAESFAKKAIAKLEEIMNDERYRK